MAEIKYTFLEEEDNSSRQELLRFFNSKTTSHIGYLITSALTLYGILTGNIIGAIFLSAILIPLMVYFTGRAYYWTIMSTTSFYVKMYSQETIVQINREFEPKNGKLKYNQLLALNNALIDFNKRQGAWVGVKKEYRYYLFKLFGGWTGKWFLIGLIILGEGIAIVLTFYPLSFPTTY